MFVVAAGQDADFAAGIGQGLNGGLDGGVLAEAFDAIADGDGAAAAAGVFAIAAAARPWIAAVSGGSGVEVDDGEAGVVVMNAAWRSVFELLDAAVAVRAAKVQKSPVLKAPVVPKEMVIPFSRMMAAPEIGMGISPLLPAAPRSVMSVMPSLAKTLPLWSQRRMRVWRLGVVWLEPSTGKFVALTLASRVMVLAGEVDGVDEMEFAGKAD